MSCCNNDCGCNNNRNRRCGCNCENGYARKCGCGCGINRCGCGKYDFYSSNFVRPAPVIPFPVPRRIEAVYGDFFALMPPDNAAAIPAGGDIAFPATATVSADGIIKSSPTAVTLTEPGTYQISFNATPTEAAQLVLTLNGAELPYTTVGATAAGSELKGTFLVTTTVPNSTITVRNPAAAAGTVTLTPTAGGTNPSSANLTVLKVA